MKDITVDKLTLEVKRVASENPGEWIFQKSNNKYNWKILKENFKKLNLFLSFSILIFFKNISWWIK